MSERIADSIHGKDAVSDCRRCAESDQAVHVRSQMPKRLEPDGKEFPVDVQDRQKQNELRHGIGHGVLCSVQIPVHERRYGQTEPLVIHMEHCHIHQRKQKRNRYAEPPLHGARLFLCLFLHGASGRALTSIGCLPSTAVGGRTALRVSALRPSSSRKRLRAVPSLFHRLNNAVALHLAFVIFNFHRLCQKIDRGIFYTLQLPRRLLHMGRAGRTGHAGYMVPLFHFFSFPLFYLSFLISSTASSTTAVLPLRISSTTQVSMCSCRIT